MNSLFLVAALTVATFTVPVRAEPSRLDTVRATIATRDLDLTTEAGVRILDRRIVVAASRLCGTPSAAVPRARTRFEQCRDAARANADTTRRRAIASARGDQTVMAASPL